jgi:hypothetical protein
MQVETSEKRDASVTETRCDAGFQPAIPAGETPAPQIF